MGTVRTCACGVFFKRIDDYLEHFNLLHTAPDEMVLKRFGYAFRTATSVKLDDEGAELLKKEIYALRKSVSSDSIEDAKQKGKQDETKEEKKEGQEDNKTISNTADREKDLTTSKEIKAASEHFDSEASSTMEEQQGVGEKRKIVSSPQATNKRQKT